jgi:putative flippase GtrA
MTPPSPAQIQFLRFALVGIAGFVVDAATLYTAMHYAGANHYGGRLISYLVAASVTWALNRRFTFHARRSARPLHEWGRFLASNALGGLLNYTTYAILVASSSTVFEHPVLGVAAGSSAGLLFNFTLSRRFVFTGQR